MTLWRSVRDTRLFTRKAFHNAAAGIDATFVLAMGGSPCQDLSGLNATKVGIGGERSGLVVELIRVVKVLQGMCVFSSTYDE